VAAKKQSASASSEPDDASDGDAVPDESSELSSPPPKKKHKKSKSEDTDAQIAARMQAEEYGRARSTRGGGAKRKSVVKKKKAKKSKAKVTDDLDSDGESGGEKKEVNRTGGFHVSSCFISCSFAYQLSTVGFGTRLIIFYVKKPLNLSPALAALLNETQLSRPQTVKGIWKYIKDHKLQDPNDRRQIQCDEPLRNVFKTDKIHMFTMNKVLNQNLYAIDE
jgi:upstream activation factor subunit UAF30